MIWMSGKAGHARSGATQFRDSGRAQGLGLRAQGTGHRAQGTFVRYG